MSQRWRRNSFAASAKIGGDGDAVLRVFDRLGSNPCAGDCGKPKLLTTGRSVAAVARQGCLSTGTRAQPAVPEAELAQKTR